MKKLSSSLTLLPLVTCALMGASQAQSTKSATPRPKTVPAKSAKPVGMTAIGTPKSAPATGQTKLTQSAAQQMVNRILKETSVLRQLSITRPVPSGVQSRDAVEKMVAGLLKDEMGAHEIEANDVMLKQLGMAPANFDLKSFYVKLMGEQIAGYYEPKTKTFYTTPQVNKLELETVMAHELTHALQDQHFNLTNLKKGNEHNADAQLAISSLIEGDATLSMSRYAMSNPLRALGVLVSPMVSPHNSEIIDQGPRSLKEGLTFPYVQGMFFATKLFQQGGWNRVSGAFKKVPLSTEKILHFEKYTSYEAPVAVSLRDLTPILGKGWMLLDYDVNGEFGTKLTLAEYLTNTAEVEKAASGWGGDNVAIYRGPKGAGLVVQDTLWDTEADAREWAQAYIKRSNLRLGISPQSRGALQVWNGASKGKPNGVWLERRGKRVIILEGQIGSFNSTPIQARLWAK